ncbi:MAG: PH domain-containing protein [Bacteroidetes bacterium]|nr:PH domain-containing protein [Bacteroidota bacterium]
MTINPFPHPTRQSSVAIIFILGHVLRLLVRQLWVVILIFIFNQKGRTLNSFTLFFIGLAGVSATLSLINYFNFYFYIRDGELVLEKGVLRKTKINVPLDRVQTVNFRQGILHQFFNVVAVDIDTAGSAGKEFSLQAIRMEAAEALRDFVENFKRTADGGRQTVDGDEQVPITSTEPFQSEIRNPKSEILFRLSPLDLLKIGASQNHLRTAGILMAFFLGFADDVEEALSFDFSKKMEEWIGSAANSDVWYYLLVGVPFLLLASFLISMVRTALQYFNLQFWRTERGFKIVSGLFTRQEVSANLTKIQYVRWTSSPLKRLFGMMSVRLPQAASVQVGRKLAVGLPGCYEPQLSAVRQAWFPQEKNLPEEEHGVDGRIARRQFLLRGLLPVAVLMEITWSMMGTWAAIWLLWLPVSWWLGQRFHRSWRWWVSDEGLRLGWGVFNRQAVLLQWYKVQAVGIRQSWFARRAGLANLTLHTAAGSVQVPYIPLAKAQAVQDFVLFKIETDQRGWM